MSPAPTFRCGCGNFQAKFKDEPVWDSTCHCRSCVAASRFIDENYGQKGDKPGTSALSDEGGSAISFFELADISFLGEGKLSDRVGHVKVGDKGKVVRTYAKCCGTQIMHCEMNMCGFNRNGLHNEDGSKYGPEAPPLNIMAKFAFEPAKIPEPKANYVTVSMLAKLLPYAAKGLFGMGYGDLKGEKAVHPDASEAEVVPITWE